MKIFHEITRLYNQVLMLPKTLYVNFKYLKFKDAIKLPIYISHKVCIRNCKGQLLINTPVKSGMIRIGFGDVRIFDKKRNHSIWNLEHGTVIFQGKARIGHGTKIYVRGGTLTFGNNFSLTAENQIDCRKSISFGNDVLVSWDNIFMDTDHHKIKMDNLVINPDKEIIIGNYVWIGCRNTILKGTIVPDNTVIAANSTVCGVYCDSGTIIGGNPAKIIKTGIEWEL